MIFLFISLIYVCYSLPHVLLHRHVMSIRKSLRRQEHDPLIQREREIFAVNLKRARKEAGLTQYDITKSTGLSQQYLSDVENAKSAINLDNANVLADAVGKPLYQLLTPPKK